jgi:hypothetical protein
MINVVDLLWIEQRGMSIITAIFFVGVFVTFGSMFWWMCKEIGDIDAELASHKLRLNDSQKEVSQLGVEIGKIRVTVENTEKLTEKLIDHILK